MIPVLFALLFVQADRPAPTGGTIATIPASDIGEFDRCRPQRIGEASECMRRALGDKAAAEIGTPAGERYRAAFTRMVTEKWDLTNPESPVARDLRGLHVYDPSDAADVLLADMAARIGRYRLDYERFAREERRAGRGLPQLLPLPLPPSRRRSSESRGRCPSTSASAPTMVRRSGS